MEICSHNTDAGCSTLSLVLQREWLPCTRAIAQRRNEGIHAIPYYMDIRICDFRQSVSSLSQDQPKPQTKVETDSTLLHNLARREFEEGPCRNHRPTALGTCRSRGTSFHNSSERKVQAQEQSTTCRFRKAKQHWPRSPLQGTPHPTRAIRMVDWPSSCNRLEAADCREPQSRGKALGQIPSLTPEAQIAAVLPRIYLRLLAERRSRCHHHHRFTLVQAMGR